MTRNNDLLLDLNILSRATQKYYDRELQDLDLNYGQLPVLLMIYEHQGITSNRIVNLGKYDKGTVTKNVQKLEKQGYVQVVDSLQDRRAKLLYPTDKAKDIISRIYGIRRSWSGKLLEGMDIDTQKEILAGTERLVDKAVQVSENEGPNVFFFKADKLNARLWPGHLCYVLYAFGCNWNCPNCPDRGRVMMGEDAQILDAQEIIEQVRKRKDLIDGVIISGGEPLLQPGMADFLHRLKRENMQVRLETNGTRPAELEELLKRRLVDSVCLQIKNGRRSYPASCGRKEIDLKLIEDSIEVLNRSGIDWNGHLVVDDRHFDDKSLGDVRQFTEKISHLRLDTHVKSVRALDPELGPMDEKRFERWKKELER